MTDDQRDPFMAEVDDWCARTGLKPSTLSAYALNDSRYLDRRRGRQDKDKAQENRLRAAMKLIEDDVSRRAIRAENKRRKTA